jgi:hypothetical protein
MSLTVTPSSRFQSIFDAALSDYAEQTGIDLARYPFANILQGNDSPDEILGFLQDRAKKFTDYREGNRKLMNYISPLAHVLYTLSARGGSAAHDESASVSLAQNLVFLI